MSRYISGGGSPGNPFAGTESGARNFYQTGGAGQPAPSAGIYTPSAPGGGTGTPGAVATKPEVQPGVLSINPIDPAGSLEQGAQATQGMFDGLATALFGPHTGVLTGGLTGALSDLNKQGNPIGQAAGFLGGIPGGLGDTVKNAADVVGGTLERVPDPLATLLGSGKELNDAYNSPEVQTFLDQTDPATGKTNREVYAGDKGPFGNGIFGTEEHYKAAAIKAYNKSTLAENPTFMHGDFQTPGSLADTVTLISDTFGAVGNAWTRTLAGVNRMDQLRQMGYYDESGDFVQTAVSTGFLGTGLFAGEKVLTPAEQLALKKTQYGDWTDDQALDFLNATGQSNHDPGVSIAASMLSPDVVASFGAAGLAKAGVKGAEIAAGAEKAAALSKAAESTLAAERAAYEATKLTRAGKAAVAAGRTTRTMRAAEQAVKEAEGYATKMRDAVSSYETYKSGTAIRRINLLARAANSERLAPTVQKSFLAFGRTYAGLEGSMLGRAAKVTRTLIDPLHAIDLHMPGTARMVDLYSDALPQTLHDVMNPIEGLKNFTMLRDLDPTGTLLDEYGRMLSQGMANMGRATLLQFHQIASVDKGLGGQLQTLGMGTEKGVLGHMEDIIADVAEHTRQKDLLGAVRESIVRNVVRQEEYWTEAQHAQLAQNLEAWLHTGTNWAEELPTMSKERKALLEFAYYAHADKLLDAAATAATSAGHASIATLGRPLQDIVLLSNKTFTRIGADSALAQLAKAKSLRKQLRIIADLQEKYPELRYITIDPANPGKGVQRFTRYLQDHIEEFPMQLKADEVASLPDDMREVSRGVRGAYTLGFRPKEQFLWGIERSNEAGGGFVAKFEPWADHVTEGSARGFHPGLDLPKNIAGMPIVGAAAQKMANVADYMGAGAAMLRQQVSGQQIHEIARQRFVGQAASSKFKDVGLTESLASKWWDRLQEYTREHRGYSGPRGFGKGDLYEAIRSEGLIPQTMLNGSMRLTESDVLRLVLNAYDGDMRFIGLTQKLSGRAKKYASAVTMYNTNFAGEIAEHAWPLLKFRYNPVFQFQEKVEPVILNAQRGITSPFISTTMTEADRAAEAVLTRLTDNSLIRQADLDQAEYFQQLDLSRKMGQLMGDVTTRHSKLQARAAALLDVQGVKRIGALRTFQKGLGREMRGAWDEAMGKGVWQDMKTTADGMAGRVLHEDEFALQVLSENLFANDILVSRRIERAGQFAGLPRLHAEWANAIKTGEWMRPSHIGELKGLDLDHVAKSMESFADGTKVRNLADLRRDIASADKPEKRIEEVSDFLRRLGADKDYIGRVENSLKFSWTGFWKEAEARYHLTFEESKALQDLMGGWADLRGMSPADFMSQVFDPGIIDGTEGLLGSLDGPLGILRRNKAGETVGRGRSRLAAPVDGTATHDDLVHQMAAVFAQHLDPSAKRALLMEFRPQIARDVKSGKLRLDMNDIKAMWDQEAEGQLADRILGYMDGAYGEAGHDVLTDEARGVRAIRAGADKYLREHGVTPLAERRHYSITDPEDVAHYDRTAEEYGALPEVEYEKTGRRPMTKQVYAADTDLKPQPAGVDDRTYKAYQQFVIETKQQFEFMTKAKSEGGLGIRATVAKGEPYTADAAGRSAMQADLAKGRLRVYGLDSDHPLMTNEQNVMFRAVHDVFGHGAEDFHFGPRGELNAAASHFKMYGPEARGPLLTETHGQTAYVNYSNDVIEGAEPPKPLDPANPGLDFEARHPFEVPKTQLPEADVDELPPDYATVRLTGFEHAYSRRLGDGIMSLTPEQQMALLQPIEDLMNQFPALRIFHLDAASFERPAGALDDNVIVGLGIDPKKERPFAITFGADKGEPVIIFNTDHLDTAHWAEDWPALHTKRNDWTREYDTFTVLDKNGKPYDVPRKTQYGVPFNVADFGTQQLTLQTVMRHEAGHAFDLDRRPQQLRVRSDGATPWKDRQGNLVWLQKPLPGYEDYHAMMERFAKDVTGGRAQLSEYGMRSDPEFAADLFALATDPTLDMEALAAKYPELHAVVDEFQTYLKGIGEWAPPVVNPLAGKTVREANALKRGSVYAPQKAGLLPQETIDEFARRYVGVGKHVESNPDVARVAQHFGAWSQKAIENGLLRGDNAVHADIIKRVGGIPIGDAAPYNYTEAMAHTVALQAMVRKWDDAYRLQYFARSRSMLERSINHPMFGLYPASYMWGKLMPEVVQFLAQRPFGLRTGGALSAAMHAQTEIALRREFDPEFDKKIEELGHSQAMSFIGFTLPTLPWDITSSFPQFAKDIAGQGIAQGKALDQHQTPKDISLTQPAVDVVGKLNPLETTIPWAGRAIDELNGTNTPEERKAALKAAAREHAVTAEELRGPLFYVMQELQAELSK